MGLIVSNQAMKPLLLDWLDTRCRGIKGVDGAVITFAYVDADEQSRTSPDDIVCVVALTRWTAHTCELTVATNGDKRAVPRSFIRAVYEYVFDTADRSRMYAFCSVENAASISGLQRLGFKQEATLAGHYGDDQPACLFGITRNDWRAGRWSRP